MKAPSLTRTSTASALALAMVLVASAPSTANQNPSETGLEIIADIAPEALENLETNPEDTDLNAIDNPKSPSLEVSAGEDALRVSLPKGGTEIETNSSAASELDTGNNSSTVTLNKAEGDVQIITVLNNPNSPNSFTYNLESPNFASLKKSEDGGLVVTDKNDDAMAFIAPPWAKDADGNEVPTHYDTEGSKLTQVVQTNSNTKYPVVADPYLGVKMVKSVKWTTKKQGKTLVVTPTAGSRAFGGGYLPGVYGWKEVSKLAKTSSTQLKWQYICHHQFAFAKKTYNLDTWKKRKSYADSVRHKCN